MALIMNASSVEQNVCVHGSWFYFKPKQMKNMDDSKVNHLTSRASYYGFVALPEEYSDPDYKKTPEGKAKLEQIEQDGINQRVNYLQALYHNEVVSLKRDKQRVNDNSDPRLDMHPQMVKHLEELAGYKAAAEKANTDKIKKIADLEKILEK